MMKSDGENTFGAILQDAREAKGFTLGQAAKVLAVPKITLWRRENNETKVDAQRLVDIAATCGFSASAMFEGKILTAPTQTVFGRLGIVVEHIERIIQDRAHAPNPGQCALKHLGFWKQKAALLIHPATTQWSLEFWNRKHECC